MNFQPIDLNTWPRKEHYVHYRQNVPCGYSLTKQIDVTDRMVRAKAGGRKVYPAVLWAVATVCNRHPECRMAERDGALGVYDAVLPVYTVFHPESETFSTIWTDYQEDPDQFCAGYAEDLKRYGGNLAFEAKPGCPENVVNVSMLPWSDFSGFNLNLKPGDYLLPIFTFGRAVEREGRWSMAVSIQAHHAAMDGFHVCRVVDELEALLKLL